MPRRYRLAYCGNFRPSHSTENHVAAALEACGHEIVRFQEDEASWRAIPERALAEGWDWLLWTRTWTLDHDAQRAMLAGLRDAGVPTVAFHLDKYWDLDREHQIRDEPWWRCDVVFSADGGNQDRFAEAGVAHVWCPPGVHGPECEPGRRRAEYECDVAFVGSARYHREWPFRDKLIAWLDARYASRFKIFPQGGAAVRGQDLNDLYASARVVVGDTLNLGRGGVPFAGSRYWSDRLPETIGRGGFLLMPHVDGMEESATDGEHLRYWQHGDLDQLAALIDAYVGDRGERDRIRGQGQRHARVNLSYEARMRNLVLPELSRRFESLRGPADWIDARTESERRAVREVAVDNVYRIDPARDLDGWVVDVGASIGELALWALDHGTERTRVLAVEPQTEALDRLGRSAERAGVASRVVVENSACGGTDRWASLAGEGPETRLLPGGGVRVRPLDKILADHGVDDVALLKLDVEGYEAEIVEAASPETLARCRYIALEWHGTGTGHDPQREGVYGALVEKLARTHHVSTLGDPRVGGYVYARRYGT